MSPESISQESDEDESPVSAFTGSFDFFATVALIGAFAFFAINSQL